jgi:hypothetical protein
MGNPGSNTARAVRVLVALVAVGFFLVGATLAGVYLGLCHIVTTATVEYAKALGIALEPTDVRFGPSFIQVLDSKFTALQVPGVSGTVQRIDVDLSGLHPTHVLLSGIAINAKGDPDDLRQSAIRYWERVRPKSILGRTEPALPKVEWRHLGLNLTTGNPLVPTASVTELTVVANAGPTHDETTIRTASTHVGVLDLGALEIAVRNQDGTFELGWGPTLLESNWRIAYRELADADQVKLSFQPQEATALLGRLGVTTVPAELGKTKVGGHVEALRDKNGGKVTGALTLNLVGFVPPYPQELKGYRFADTTTMRSRFEIDPLWSAAELRGIELKSGDLSLIGHGRIDRELLSARLRAELTTTLDCVTLAKGYASEEIGGELGQWGAKNAFKAVRGSVSVRVQVDAVTGHLDQAKIVKRIGIGCGLRPMSIVDLLNLGLPPIPDPKTVERLIKQIPPETVISNLPTLPQILPSLEELQSLGEKANLGAPKGPKKVNQTPATTSASPKSRTSPVAAHTAAK